MTTRIIPIKEIIIKIISFHMRCMRILLVFSSVALSMIALLIRVALLMKMNVFPNVYSYSNDSIQNENKKINDLFLIVPNPCQETVRFLLYPGYYRKYYKYMFFANSSLYLPFFDIFVESTSYCLAVVDYNQFDAIICLETVNEAINKKMNNITNFLFLSCHIVSMFADNIYGVFYARAS